MPGLWLYADRLLRTHRLTLAAGDTERRIKPHAAVVDILIRAEGASGAEIHAQPMILAVGPDFHHRKKSRGQGPSITRGELFEKQKLMLAFNRPQRCQSLLRSRQFVLDIFLDSESGHLTDGGGDFAREGAQEVASFERRGIGIVRDGVALKRDR